MKVISPHSLIYCCQVESGRIKNKAEIDYMNGISHETLTKTVSLPSCVEGETTLGIFFDGLEPI